MLRNNAILDAEAHRTLPRVPDPRAIGRLSEEVVATGGGEAATTTAGGAAGTATGDRTLMTIGAAAMRAQAVHVAVSGASGETARMASTAGIGGAPSGKRKRARSANNLQSCTSGDLSLRPRLGALGQLFKLPPQHKVPVLTTVEFDATFDFQTRSTQPLRASPQFKNGQPWYDAILFELDAEKSTKDGAHDRGDAFHEGHGNSDAGREEMEATIVHAGEVRVIVWCKDDDHAVIYEMDVVDGEPSGPFDARFFTRFKWAGCAPSGPVIRAVPLRNVTRFIHVVPDFKHLASRKGLGLAAARFDGPRADLHAMRYFLNEFDP